MADSFEQVEKIPAGFDAGGRVVFDSVRTGRARSPQSVEQWCALRVAMAGKLYQALPARQAVNVLLAQREAADVRAIGQGLDDRARWGVLLELRRLAEAASLSFPPATALMRRLLAEWVKWFGDAEWHEPRDRAARRRDPYPATRVAGVAGYDSQGLAAAWSGLTFNPAAPRPA